MLAALVTGCATPPDDGPVANVKPVTTYGHEASFAAPDGRWPAPRWWQAYSDPKLDALIEEALRNAPSMAQAAARFRAAEAMTGAARADTLPSISIDGSPSISRPSTRSGIPVLPERQGYHDYGSVHLGFAWELDLWGRNRAALAAATSEAEAARADMAAAQLALSTSVAATYADIVRLYNDRDVLEQTLEVREKTLNILRSRVRHGYDSDADLAQAEAGPPAARADLAAADEAIGLARNRLSALLGAGPDRGAHVVRPGTPLPPAFGLPGDLASGLLGRRPDIRAARYRVEAAGKLIKVAEAGFYPNVNLLGLIGLESLGLDNLLNGGSEVGSAGPAIDLPIFDGGRRRAEYRGKRAQYEIAVASYDEVLTQALREVADVVVSSRQLALRLAGAEDALRATERAYRLAQLRYQQGATDYQSVLIVEDRLLERRRVLAALRSRRFILDVALVRSLGGGTAP